VIPPPGAPGYRLVHGENSVSIADLAADEIARNRLAKWQRALKHWPAGAKPLLSETMAFGSAILASAVLIAAGVYQWTPLKDTCLRHCRSPTEFLSNDDRGRRRIPVASSRSSGGSR